MKSPIVVATNLFLECDEGSIKHEVPSTITIDELNNMLKEAYQCRGIPYDTAKLVRIDRNEGYVSNNLIILDRRFPVSQQIATIIATRP